LNKEFKFQAVLDIAPDGILIAKANGIIEYGNSEAGKIFDSRISDVIGQDVRKILSIESKEINDFSICSVSSQEFKGKKKDGALFPFLLTVREVKDENEMMYAFFIQDLTQQKKQEEILSQYTSELERSNEDLKEFAYISSHDLQEPLRKIHALVEILMQSEFDQLSAEGKDYFTRIAKSTLRMQNLINDLLSFARIATQPVIFEKVDLNDLLKEVLIDLEVRVEKGNAVVHYSNLPSIDAEPSQLRQVFQNIISNALKFRKDGVPPLINIKSKRTEGASQNGKVNEFVEISFEDNGIGFDEKHLDKIFNVFQRLEGRKFEGSGIGLAICRKIITYHGGEITARSTPGKGSVFIIKLPLKSLL
jgi:two-component system, LuxR family, sensor kinase FixL